MLQTRILVKFIYSINIYCVPTQCKHYSRTFFPGNRKGGESMSTDVPGVDKTSGWRSLGGGSLLVAEAICDTVH